MTSYLVRQGAQKKRGILEKREETLRHHIRNEYPQTKLILAAEAVRSSQIAVIKCLLHENEIVRTEDEEKLRTVQESLYAQSKQWEELSTPDLVAIYKKAVDK